MGIRYANIGLKLDVSSEGLLQATVEFSGYGADAPRWSEKGTYLQDLGEVRKLLTETAGKVIGAADLPGQGVDRRTLGRTAELDLFPPRRAQEQLRQTRRRLGRVGLRILLSVADADDPEGLLDLPWECANVPATTTGAGNLALRDELLSIVRVVATPEQPVTESLTRQVVLVDASGVAGDQRIVSTQTVLNFGPGGTARDGGLIRGELNGTPFEPFTVPKPTVSSALGGWDRAWAFYFFGHHLDREGPTGERLRGLVLPTSKMDQVGLLGHGQVAATLAERNVVLAVFAACASAGGPDGSGTGSLARSVAAEGVRYAVGIYGPTNHLSMEDFAESLFREVASGAAVDAAIAVARHAHDAKNAIPMLYTCVPDDLVAYQSPVKLPAPAAFRGWWVDPAWVPSGRPLPVSDANPARLDVLLALSTGPVTMVVADEAGKNLRAELHGLSATAGKHSQSRVWHSLDAKYAAPESLTALAEVVTGPDGGRPDAEEFADQYSNDSTGLGLVVTYSVEPGTVWTYQGAASKRLARFVRLRDTEVQDAALVIQVCAEEPADALVAVLDVAEGALTKKWSFDVVTRVQPGTAVGEPVHSMAERPLTALADLVAHSITRRGLMPPWPLSSSSAVPGDSPGAPAQVAAAVVGELNADQEVVPGGDERRFLLMVRDWAPAYFLPLLVEHAAERAPTGWWHGLAAAAPFDDHLQRWFESACRSGRPEFDRPEIPLDLSPSIVAALVWVASRQSGGAQLVAGWARAADASTERLLTADPATPPERWFAEPPQVIRRWTDGRKTVAALMDADLGSTRGFWAVLSSLPVDRQMLEAFEQLPDWLRQVVNPHAYLFETDPARAELLEVLGRVLRPYRRALKDD